MILYCKKSLDFTTFVGAFENGIAPIMFNTKQIGNES